MNENFIRHPPPSNLKERFEKVKEFYQNPKMHTEKTIRLQKFLSEQGVASRREAEEWIQEGRISVNGETAVLGQKINPATDVIKVNSRLIKPTKTVSITLAMNKPKGYVCTHQDPHAQKTIYQLLPKNLQAHKFICAGRLDKESEGLVILTTDGDLAHQILHPSHSITKKYHVTLSKSFDTKLIPKLLKGIRVQGEFLFAKKIIPASHGPDKECRLEVHLEQGRKREIRRMFEHLGFFVTYLKRFQIGNFVLKTIPKGSIEILNTKDIELLLARKTSRLT